MNWTDGDQLLTVEDSPCPFDIGRSFSVSIEHAALARGSSSEVSAGVMEDLDGNKRRFAIKKFHGAAEGADFDAAAIAAKAEYEILERLNGLDDGDGDRFAYGSVPKVRARGTLKALGRGADDYNRAAIVEELFEGASLDAWIRENSIKGKLGRNLSPEETAASAWRLAQVLKRLHSLGVHQRDFQPSNIIISQDDDGKARFNLVDFGSAVTVGGCPEPGSADGNQGSRYEDNARNAVTRAFGAPEMALDDAGGSRLGASVDIWGLGCVIYYMRTGEIPHWRSENGEHDAAPQKAIPLSLKDAILESEHIAELSTADQALHDLIEACTQRDAEDRQSLGGVIEVLDSIRGDKPAGFPEEPRSLTATDTEEPDPASSAASGQRGQSSPAGTGPRPPMRFVVAALSVIAVAALVCGAAAVLLPNGASTESADEGSTAAANLDALAPAFCTTSTSVRRVGEEEWHEKIYAEFGNEYEVRINYSNTEELYQSGIVIQAFLDDDVKLVEGSVVLYSTNNEGGIQVTDEQALTGDGIDIGGYELGSSAYVQFRVALGYESNGALRSWSGTRALGVIGFVKLGEEEQHSIAQLYATHFTSTWGDNDGLRNGYTQDEVDGGILGDGVVMNSITDSPHVGDERVFTTASADGGDVWSTGYIDAEIGETYTVRMYVVNDNPLGYGAIAQDVTAWFEVTETVGKQGEICGCVTSSNGMPDYYENSVVFVSDRFFRLEYVEGSARLINGGIGANGGAALGDSIVGEGALIGYDALDGSVPGSSQYASYVTIEVEVVAG